MLPQALERCVLRGGAERRQQPAEAAEPRVLDALEQSAEPCVERAPLAPPGLARLERMHVLGTVHARVGCGNDAAQLAERRVHGERLLLALPGALPPDRQRKVRRRKAFARAAQHKGAPIGRERDGERRGAGREGQRRRPRQARHVVRGCAPRGRRWGGSPGLRGRLAAAEEHAVRRAARGVRGAPAAAPRAFRPLAPHRHRDRSVGQCAEQSGALRRAARLDKGIVAQHGKQLLQGAPGEQRVARGALLGQRRLELEARGAERLDRALHRRARRALGGRRHCEARQRGSHLGEHAPHRVALERARGIGEMQARLQQARRRRAGRWRPV